VRRTELHDGEVLRWLAKEQVDEVYEILGFQLCIENTAFRRVLGSTAASYGSTRKGKAGDSGDEAGVAGASEFVCTRVPESERVLGLVRRSRA
jgi:hypothetical protein